MTLGFNYDDLNNQLNSTIDAGGPTSRGDRS